MVVGHNITQEKVPTATIGFLTLRLSDTAGGRVVDLVVDSMSITRADGRTVPDAGDGTGSRWHGIMAEDGKFTVLASPPIVPATRPLDRYVRFFFPPARSAGRQGESWVDSTAWTATRNGTAPAGPERATVTATGSGHGEYTWVQGEACPAAAWRAGSTTLTRMARAFREPVTTTTNDSMAVTRISLVGWPIGR